MESVKESIRSDVEINIVLKNYTIEESEVSGLVDVWQGIVTSLIISDSAPLISKKLATLQNFHNALILKVTDDTIIVPKTCPSYFKAQDEPA